MGKVRSYRLCLGKTQKEMAEKLGISRQAYSAKERGNYSFNDNEKKLIKELFAEVKENITIDEIFFG